MVRKKVDYIDDVLNSKMNHPIIAFLAFSSTKLIEDIYQEVFRVVGVWQSALFLVTLFIVYLIFNSVYKSRVNKIKEWKKSEIEKLKNTEIDSSVHSRKLKKEYRGLIALISVPPGKIKKEQWLADCRKEIDQYPENETKILGLPGVGQTFRAILHHKNKLEQIWLIHSEKSEVNLEIIKYFLEKVMTHKIKVVPVKIDDTENMVNIRENIENVFKSLPDKLKIKDVISDITGGTKPMSAALVLSCLHPERNMEYVEQNNNELIEVELSQKFANLEF